MRRLRTGLDKDDTIIRRHRRRRPRPRPHRRLRRRCRRRAVANYRRSRGKGVATSRSRTFAPGAPGKTRLRGIPLSGPPTRPLSRVPLYFLLLLHILPCALLRLSHPSVPHSASLSLPTLCRLGGDQGSLFSPPTALPASPPPPLPSFLATTAGVLSLATGRTRTHRHNHHHRHHHYYYYHHHYYQHYSTANISCLLLGLYPG